MFIALVFGICTNDLFHITFTAAAVIADLWREVPEILTGIDDLCKEAELLCFVLLMSGF
jgi:hypothetical protein